MRAKRVSIRARRRDGIPRLTPQPMAPDTARLGTIRHIERRARSLKESPPMEVFAATTGCCGPRILGQLECPVKASCAGFARKAAAPQSRRPDLRPAFTFGLPEVRVCRRFGTRRVRCAGG